MPSYPQLRRRVLFVLRGKLGETVVAFATVRAFADAFPGDEVTLLVRANYLPLFEGEAGMRVIGFSSRLAMFAKLALLRFFEAPFDALLVLLGAGPPIERLGRMVRARRMIFLDGRFKDVYTEWPQVPDDHRHFEPAWLVARTFEPGLPAPQESRIPSLAMRRRPMPIVAIAPVSDEPRRSMAPGTVRALIEALARWHPGCEIRVLVNPADRDAQPLLEAGKNAGLPAGAQFERFRALQTLIDSLCRLERLYTTDTGLYHLAAAIGVPTTAYYGPTQPWKNGFPAQAGLRRVRLAALGGDHCEEKQCREPVCLASAVALQAGARVESSVDGTPARCLLRRHAAAELARLAVLDGPQQTAAREAIPVH
jgi:ADP-heptose:LPS heptosyltransferase